MSGRRVGGRRRWVEGREMERRRVGGEAGGRGGGVVGRAGRGGEGRVYII